MEQKNGAPSCEGMGRQYSQNDDEIDLRELFAVIWKGKIVIALCTLVCACIAVTYAFMAQEWWTAKAKVMAPATEEFSAYLNQVSQFQPVFDDSSFDRRDDSFDRRDDSFDRRDDSFDRRDDSFDRRDDSLNALKESKNIFNQFVQEFNSTVNKKEFFSKNPEYQKMVQGLTEEEMLRVNDKWFSRVSAKLENAKAQDGSYVLSFQAKGRNESVTYLKEYIAFIKQKSVKKGYAQLTALVDARRVELEQNRVALLADARAKLNAEIVRAQYALEIAQAADVGVPVQINGEEIFPIEIGAPALGKKLDILTKIKDLSLFQPGLVDVDARLALLKQLSIDTIDRQFAQFHILEDIEKPLSRDKPKRALIAVLGTLLGGMLGVAFVLVRHAFGRKEDTV